MKDSKVMMSPTRLTAAQMAWLEREASRTGGSVAAVVRGLIQSAMERKA